MRLKMLRTLVLAVVAGCGTGIVRAEPAAATRSPGFYLERGVTFYASFETSLTADYAPAAARREPIQPLWRPLYQQQKIEFVPGRQGNCASATALDLVYDPVHVFAPDRGSVSFWFKPVAGDIWSLFKVTAKEWGVGPNSRLQMDLYQSMFLFGTSPLLRSGFYRALIRPALNAIEECVSLPPLTRDSWHHFVWVWDHTAGMRGYLNGEKIFDNWGTVTWVPMMTPSVMQFGSVCALDELIFFGQALAPADVARLHRGEFPDPRPQGTDVAVPEDLRDALAHSYGLDEIPVYPVVTAETPVTFTAVDFEAAHDRRRPMLYCLDGNRVSCWPDSHVELFNSDYLDITYPGEVEANYFRVIADGNRFAVSKDGEAEPFWIDEVRAEHDGWGEKLVRRCFTGAPLRFTALRLDRKGARIGEFYVYNVRAGAPSPAGPAMAYRLARVADLRSVSWAHDVYARYHGRSGPAVMAAPSATTAAPITVPGKPLVPFHLFSPDFAAPTGVGAISFQLAFTAPPEKLEDVLRLRIIDPVTHFRDLANIEFKLRFDPERTGAQVFRITVDLPDFLFNPGTCVWAWLVSRDGSALSLSESRLTVHTVSAETAAESMVRRTMRLVAHAYSRASEGHRWSRSYKWPGDEHYYYTWSLWPGLLNIVRNRLAPENRIVGTYWHTIRPRTHASFTKEIDFEPSRELRELEHARFEAPDSWPNPAAAPAWALYQNALLNTFLRIVHWWHDQRLAADIGVLGGYGDDTQFTGDAFWIYFASGDPKLFRILESVTNGTWRHPGVYRGFPARTNDVAHDTEEVVGAWPLMIVADYGNPKYLEMTMTTMSLFDFFTTRTALGHRHFRSWYLSATGMQTQGRYGVDNLANAQFAALGHSLGWYNRCPKLVQYYREWCDAWMADWERAGELEVKRPISVRMPEDIPIPHVGAMSSHTMQHHFFVTGLLTGETKYIERALHNTDGAFFRYYRGEWDQGMLLRNFAFLRHRLFEDETLKDARPLQRPDVFTRYLLNKDKQLLADEYRRALDGYAGGTEFLYTEAQPSLDRLWGLFHEPMFMGMLGGHPTGHRRSSTWPGMALSFVDAGGDLAALVLENRTSRMACLLFNFSRERRAVTLRLWQLEPGEYEISCGPDADGDDRPDSIAYRERQVLERASRLTLPVPFGMLQAVEVRQVSRHSVPDLLPDLALSADDVSLDRQAGIVSVTVHNVGSVAAGPFEVRLLDKRGRALGTRKADGLAAPVDLRPRRLDLDLPLDARDFRRLVSVRVEPVERTREITTANNTVACAAPRER